LHVHGVSFFLGIDPTQVMAFNALESELNSDIAHAAQQVNQSFGSNRIVIVDVNALTKRDGRSCTSATNSHPLINGVLFAPGESLAKLYDDCIHGTHSLVARCTESISAVKTNFIAKGSLHPTRTGQLLIARAVVAAIRASTSSSAMAALGRRDSPREDDELLSSGRQELLHHR
jgi:hypothetical protein